jgi:hypothetical protein
VVTYRAEKNDNDIKFSRRQDRTLIKVEVGRQPEMGGGSAFLLLGHASESLWRDVKAQNPIPSLTLPRSL